MYHEHEDREPAQLAAELLQLSQEKEDAELRELQTLEEMKKMEARLKALEAKESKFNASALELERIKRESACVPTQIGGADGIHPHELDIAVGSSPSQLLANMAAIIGKSDAPFPGHVHMALVPVLIWPYALQDKRKPYVLGRDGSPMKDRETDQPLRNLKIGQTSIQQSYATCRILVDSTPREVSISGVAILNINPFNGLTPKKIHDSLSKRTDQTTFERLASPSNLEDSDTGIGTFIPSQVPTQRESSPTSN